MARGFNTYNAEDYAEMVRLAKLHGSMRKAAREFGTSYSTKESRLKRKEKRENGKGI